MVRAARPDSPSSRRTTFAPRRGRRWAWMNPKTSAVVTTVGSLPTMAKNTLRSNATANQLLVRSLAPAKARYSSTRGWPSVMATISWPSATRSRTGLQRIEDSRIHAGARATARRRARGISPTYWEIYDLVADGVQGGASGASGHRVLRHCHDAFAGLSPTDPTKIVPSIADGPKRGQLNETLHEFRDFLHRGRHPLRTGH